MAPRKKRSCSIQLGDASSPLRHRLLHLFFVLGPAFSRWAESQHAEGPLTPQRMRLSELLFDNGPTKMCDLRHELGVTATNVTALVDALEEDGLVERLPHPSDRRATLIQLTAKARKSIAFGCNQYKDKASALFADFSLAEQEQLFRLLMKMREGLLAREILEPSSLHETAKEKR